MWLALPKRNQTELDTKLRLRLTPKLNLYSNSEFSPQRAEIPALTLILPSLLSLSYGTIWISPAIAS